MHPIEKLATKYPQLRLPIDDGTKDTELYKNVCLRGMECDRKPEFSYDERDTLETVETPAGPAEVLTLYKRKDFEHAIRALAARCQKIEIPASMGASAVSGLINWDKIRPHMNSEEELDAFLADKRNYLDSIIILSNGGYSAVPADCAGLGEEEWLEESLVIRKYHELTHFVSGRLFPENKEAIRDEVIADMIGIIAARAYYDTKLAKLFLGTEGEHYREGGRLQNYGDGNADKIMKHVNRMIEELKSFSEEKDLEDVFAFLQLVESNRIAFY